MKPRLLAAALAILVGIVWIGQGLGYIPGSFMTGDALWAAAGVALVVGGSIIVALERRRRPPAA